MNNYNFIFLIIKIQLTLKRVSAGKIFLLIMSKEPNDEGIHIKIKKPVKFAFYRLFIAIHWWSWRDSNPRPNTITISFLHAYFIIICRRKTGNEQTNHALSCMVLSNGHSLPLQHSVFCFESAAEPGNRPTCSTRP